MSMTGSEWVGRLAGELGVEPPTPEETDALLALAGVAAHRSERTAAPLSTWLAGRAGVSPAEAKAAAGRLAAALDAEDGSRAGPST
ncbi:MAG: DUF6457 domain-containing protein [Acidimicrobiales bacterium]